MKAALAVPCLTPDLAANAAEIERYARQAADQGAALILFPEAVLTGFAHVGDPVHDRHLAVEVPGPETERLANLALGCSLYLAIGLLERDGCALYDSALLFGPDGQILLKYRRVSHTWHFQSADPAVYREGRNPSICHTPLGSFAFLICGDITFDTIVDSTRALSPDWLLFPLAGGFDADVRDEQEWEEQEIKSYRECVARIGAPTLLVNYVGEMDGCFGGAVAYSSGGTVIARLPLRTPGILVVELLGRR